MKKQTFPLLFLALIMILCAPVVRAQQFDFEQKVYEAKSSDILPIKIVARNITEPIGGALITLRVNVFDNELVQLSNARSELLFRHSDFQLYESTSSIEPTNSGLITGQVWEYRAAIAVKNTPNLGFEIQNGAPILNLRIPIAFRGSGRVMLEMVSVTDEDGMPLTSAVTGRGEYIKNDEGRGFPTAVTTILVNASDEEPIMDFSLSANRARFFPDEFRSGGVAEATDKALVARISQPDSSIVYRNRTALFGPWATLERDSLLVTEWDAFAELQNSRAVFGANSTQVGRSVVVDSSEFTGDDSVAVWVRGQDNQYSKVEPYAGLMTDSQAGDEEGSIYLNAASKRLFSMDQLAERNLEYNRSFLFNVKAGWTDKVGGDQQIATELETSYNGLAISLLPNQKAYGVWTAEEDTTRFVVSSSRLYQVEGTLILEGEPLGSDEEIIARIRLANPSYSFSASGPVIINSSTVAGEIPVQFWLQTPSALDGTEAILQFDALTEGVSSRQRLELSTIRVVSYRNPLN